VEDADSVLIALEPPRASKRAYEMTRPQFRPTTRPLRPISYLRAARRFRQLVELIERYCEQKDAHERARLTRAIHGLAYAARGLSERHRRAAAAISPAAEGGGPE
jgi:hypothetical protein